MTEALGSFDEELSSRPSVSEVLQALLDEHSAGDADINRITIRVLANGDVTYRMHPADGGFYIGGLVNV